VISVPTAINLIKDSASEKLNAVRIFSDSMVSQAELDSSKAIFYNLPFYRSLLYNPETKAYLMGVKINRDTINSPRRTQVVETITRAVKDFESKTKIGYRTHYNLNKRKWNYLIIILNYLERL
jgi:hypothetical protein